MLVSINFKKDHIYLPILISIFIIKSIIDDYLVIDFFAPYYRLISYISQICLFIFYFIEKYLFKEETNSKNEDKIEQIFSKKMILIILLLIFNSIDNYIINIFKITIYKGNYVTIISFFMIFERLIFNKYFYPHQFISIIIISVLFICYFIYNIFQSNLHLNYILFILSNYSYSFTIFLIKYLNTMYFINIYLLGSIHGFFELIQLVIHYYNIFEFPSYNLYNIFIIILSFILMLITNFIFFKIIFKLNPIHIFVINYIGNIIMNLEKNDFIDYVILGPCVIISLIYLEILILNFCNLNKGIKDNIIKRSKEEIIKELAEGDFNDKSEIENEND